MNIFVCWIFVIVFWIILVLEWFCGEFVSFNNEGSLIKFMVSFKWKIGWCNWKMCENRIIFKCFYFYERINLKNGWKFDMLLN